MDAAALAKAKSDERRAHLEAFRAAQAAKRAASLGQKTAEAPSVPAKATVSRSLVSPNELNTCLSHAFSSRRNHICGDSKLELAGYSCR